MLGPKHSYRDPSATFRDVFMRELTSKGSPRFRPAQVYYTDPRRELALGKEIAERMMGQRKSPSECQKKQMPLEVPSVNLPQGGVQSAKRNAVMLIQTGYIGYLTIPLKDATSPVDYLR
jgi:hypothetical protein